MGTIKSRSGRRRRHLAEGFAVDVEIQTDSEDAAEALAEDMKAVTPSDVTAAIVTASTDAGVEALFENLVTQEISTPEATTTTPSPSPSPSPKDQSYSYDKEKWWTSLLA